MPKINTREVLGIQTDNCPICGHQPKVIIDVEAFEHGVYECVTVKCHRLFHRKHLKVHGRGNTLTKAAIDGIQHWNNEAQRIWLDKHLNMRKEIVK